MRECNIEMMSTAQELTMWPGASGMRGPEAVIPPGASGRFHDRNPEACLGKVAGRDEPVVPGSDHDHVDHRRQLIRLKRRRARR